MSNTAVKCHAGHCGDHDDRRGWPLHQCLEQQLRLVDCSRWPLSVDAILVWRQMEQARAMQPIMIHRQVAHLFACVRNPKKQGPPQTVLHFGLARLAGNATFHVRGIDSLPDAMQPPNICLSRCQSALHARVYGPAITSTT